jgi:hypothetical protein
VRVRPRAIYTFFYNVLIRRLFGVRMRDINFAFKLCRRRIFEHVELVSEGSFIDAELIIRAASSASTSSSSGSTTSLGRVATAALVDRGHPGIVAEFTSSAVELPGCHRSSAGLG